MPKPEPWETGLEQLRAEYARLVPWRSPTELEDMVLEAYGRCEEAIRQWRKEQKKMTRIALVDLDGVVANRDAREAKAKEIAEEWLAAHRHGNVILKEYGTPGVKDIYWQAFFNPEYVVLDALIEGTYQALDFLQRDGHKVILLTSRPEQMREATQAWLAGKSLVNRSLQPFPLILKPLAFKFVKTPVWKAGMVQTLATLYQAESVIFVDDREENWNELLKYTPYVNYSLEWFSSLQEAVTALKEEESEL